jgi:putative Mn2+ efflux pump MntP
MSIITIVIALSLALDCFSAALGLGTCGGLRRSSLGLRMASSFGFFQSAMLAVGWAGGSLLAEFLPDVDHWIAFFVLCVAGIHMVYGSLRESHGYILELGLLLLISLSVATSIDALMVGVGAPFIGINPLQASIYAGLTAFILTLAGHWLGTKVGRITGRWAGAIGGAVLITLGTKILIEHLCM